MTTRVKKLSKHIIFTLNLIHFRFNKQKHLKLFEKNIKLISILGRVTTSIKKKFRVKVPKTCFYNSVPQHKRLRLRSPLFSDSRAISVSVLQSERFLLIQQVFGARKNFIKCFSSGFQLR
jgi:hypothetical protein